MATQCNQLPPDFAQQLMNAEIEFSIQKIPSQATIGNLIALYTNGFSYFEAIGSPKCAYFQTKMKGIFQYLNNPQNNRLQTKQLRIRPIPIPNTDQLSTIVKQNKVQQTKIIAMIASQIDAQQQSVEEKIMKRKRRLLTKSMSMSQSKLFTNETTDSLNSSQASSPQKSKITPLKVSFENFIREQNDE